MTDTKTVDEFKLIRQMWARICHLPKLQRDRVMSFLSSKNEELGSRREAGAESSLGKLTPEERTGELDLWGPDEKTDAETTKE